MLNHHRAYEVNSYVDFMIAFPDQWLYITNSWIIRTEQSTTVWIARQRIFQGGLNQTWIGHGNLLKREYGKNSVSSTWWYGGDFYQQTGGEHTRNLWMFPVDTGGWDERNGYEKLEMGAWFLNHDW